VLKRGFAVLAFLLALSPAPRPVLAQEREGFVVIVNASNETTEMSEDLVARIFLRKVRTWRSGKPAVPVDSSLVSPVRLSFSRKVLGMSSGEIRDYWMKQTLSGGELAPSVRSTEQEILEFVRAESGRSLTSPRAPGCPWK
jgi:ABC-type phosphate transport system substrate-binding protein